MPPAGVDGTKCVCCSRRCARTPGSVGMTNFRVRVGMCALLAVIGGHMANWAATHELSHRDFGQTWFAARAVLSGHDPYSLIGPGRAFEWPAPWFYPLPAALVAAPLAPLPEIRAMTLFAVISVGLFAWAV